MRWRGQNRPTHGIFTFSTCTRSYHDTRRCRDTFRCNSANLIFSTPARHGMLLSASRCGGVGKIGLHMDFLRSPYAHAPTTIQGGVVTPSCVIRKTLIFSTPARNGTGLSASRCGGVGKIGLHMEFSRSPYAHAPTTIQGGVVTHSSVIRKTLIFSTPARRGTGLSEYRC